jgi:ABC-type transport system involved in multi-copper enzyme maturation permease subunit
MVVEQPELLAFPWNILTWLLIVGSLAIGGILFGWLIAALRHGPMVALRMTGHLLAAGATDLAHMSPRRVWALSWLALRESIRRRVVVVFMVFIVVLLFAGWFLDPGSAHPAQLYLSFVLTATSYLVLLLALFLSSLSLPSDIKNKTLHTVVTKPVRPSEVVLGRMIGFTLIGTALLLVMGTISYGFVIRGLQHTHELSTEDLEKVAVQWTEQAEQGEPQKPQQLRTSRVHGHRHNVYLDPKTNRVRNSTAQGHWHELEYELPSKSKKAEITYRMGPPRGRLIARVPIYGKLRFLDRAGNTTDKGVNVGDEWMYRSFIAGGTLAAAVWTFDGITEDRFPESQFPKGLPLEMTIEVFRTYKGITDDPKGIPAIPGSLSVRNPKNNEMVEAKIFPAKDFTVDVQYIPRKLRASDGRTVDLFEDLVADGKLEVWLRCLQPAQYFGAAQADVYFRARNASFTLNFAKGYLGIWLQMTLVIAIGVMFSTFLSGPVAMIATLGALVGGFFGNFMGRLAAGEVIGGGPMEALIRLLTQANLTQELDRGLRTTVAQMFDVAIGYPLWVASAVLPEFGHFNFADYVAYGFDISADTVGHAALGAVAFLLPIFVAAYFFLKMREVAK